MNASAEAFTPSSQVVHNVRRTGFLLRDENDAARPRAQTQRVRVSGLGNGNPPRV